eukprot:COSAG01_NODE_1525_length_10018_cov_4.556709_1_plen_75_part_00
MYLYEVPSGKQRALTDVDGQELQFDWLPSVFYSPDGTQLLVAGKLLYVYDAATRELRHEPNEKTCPRGANLPSR